MVALLIILHSFFNNPSHRPDSLQTFHINGYAQGTSYSLTYVASQPLVSKTEIDQLLQSIDSSLSLYKSFSLISAFNKSSKGIKIDHHLETVVKKAIEVSAITNGAFDISCKPIIQLWNNQKKPDIPPAKDDIRKTLAHTGFQHLILKQDSLLKDHPNVQIDCDGIAQGYSVDQLASIFIKKNIKDFIIELGGEIFASGHPINRPNWQIAIQSTAHQLDDISKWKVALNDKSITTSGSMNKFIQLGNQYFSHVVNPITGYPVSNKIIAVTVIANDAITADALDNALMVMGIEKAFQWVKKYPDLGIYIQYVDEKGIVRETTNSEMKKYMLN